MEILLFLNLQMRVCRIIDRASGIIVETGGLTSHAAIIALHFDIPTIIGAENATNIIKDGQLVTIDTVGGLVYDGDVKVL